MSSQEPCALCGTVLPLRDSHIIPRFVGKWIKETSATGYLRQAVNPDRRRQDLMTQKLLCQKCEGRFSDVERRFANEIFLPFQKGKLQWFECEPWLKEFAASLAWRVCTVELPEFAQTKPEWGDAVQMATKRWGQYLLGQVEDPGPSEQHILFLDSVKHSAVELPQRFHRYCLRGVDATIGSGKDMVHVYVKLPGIVLMTSIQPSRLTGWKHTQISDGNIVGPPQYVETDWFGEFILDRISRCNDLMSGMSDKSREVIDRAIAKDPKRLETSDTLRVMELDAYWNQIQRKARD